MRKRIYIESNCGDDIRNDVFKFDYTDSLDRCMVKDENGFWRSCGNEVILEQKSSCHVFYKKDWMELEFSHESLLNGNKEVIQFRECVNSSRLEVLVIMKKDQAICPAIVICLGGPIIPMPDFLDESTIYRHFIEQGFALIIPLRRGISGMCKEWEQALDGHYGEYDVDDTISATDFVMSHHQDVIDTENIFLYGGSYGGYVAGLIAGKANSNQRYKAIVIHCGVYDLATYPWHSQGVAEETMETYGGTTDMSFYTKKIKAISPKTYITEWNVPILLVHHLNDTTTWVGQSVAAYNDALKLKKQVSLLIVKGPHTYDIPQKKSLFLEISLFFKSI